MPIPLETLADVDPALVEAKRLIAVQRVSENNPTLNVRRGFLHDNVLGLFAILDAAREEDLQRYLSARSLRQISLDPTLADTDVVDDVLSNHLITRREAAAARGTIVIELAAAVGVTIAAGAIFEAGGQQFVTDRVYAARTDEALVQSADDRLLRSTPAGTYIFTIEVTAATPGAAGMLRRDTALVPQAPPLNFVAAYAAGDFTGGLDALGNDALLAQLQEGLAARGNANRTNMRALLRDIRPSVRSAIVGFGDPEQVRDQHTLWPGSGGGRVDWYIRTEEMPVTTGRTVTAGLVAIHADGTGTWQFALGRDDVPGFYDVTFVRPTGSVVAGSYAITLDSRGFDPDDSVDILTAEEAAYSRYQTAVIQFLDPSLHDDLEVGATREYDIGVRCMPDIALIQDAMDDRDYRPVTGDLLVRAPVPCFVSVEIVLHKRADVTTPDSAAIAASVVRAVNATGFTGRLYADALVQAARQHLEDGTSVRKLVMTGQLRYPDGTVRYLQSSEQLAIPEDAPPVVSYRTVQFLATPEDCSVTVLTDLPEAV